MSYRNNTSDPFGSKAPSTRELADKMLSQQREVETVTEYVEVEVVPDGAMVRRDDHWEVFGVMLDPLGLEIPGDLDDETFTNLTATLFELEDQTQLWIGDLLNATRGHKRYSDLLALLISDFNRDEETLNKYARICNGVPKRLRRRELTISHYEKVYAMNEKRKAHWLAETVKHGWTVMELSEKIKGKRPTLSAVERFMSSFKHARKSYLDLAKEAEGEGRRQMANGLRSLADEIERLG